MTVRSGRVATTAASETALTYISRWVEGDPILSALREGRVRSNLSAIEPSGVDLVAAAVARCAIHPNGPRQVALALPRGSTTLPIFLGLYFALGRANGVLRLNGCVSVASRDKAFRDLLRTIHVSGTGSAVPVGRLVTGRPDPSGNASAKVGELIGTRRLHGLAPDKRHLLLQQPHYRPSLTLNALSVSIVDSASMSTAGWEMTYAWNKAGLRSQVWVGELGDSDFESFCSSNDVPLWKFDWGTIAQTVREFGVGGGRFASTALCLRGESPPTFRLRPCPDLLVDEELVKLEQAFGSVQRRTKGENPPVAYLRARRLHYLLSRLVAPLAAYEPIAAASRALEPGVALRQVRETPRGWFRGDKWKSVFDGEWASIRAGLTALYERVREEYPKYYDALALIDEARERGEHLVFRCPTRAEANALASVLIADGILAPDELGESGFVDVRSFGTSSPPLRFGAGDAPVRSIVSEPLARFFGAAYLSAEEGHYEALLYPSQLARIERLARMTTTEAFGGESNAAVIERFTDICVAPSEEPAPEITFERLEPFELSGRRAVKEMVETKEILSMESFFERMLDDRDGETSYSSGAGGGREQRSTRLLTSAEGFHVFLPEDAEIPVLIRDDRKLLTCPVAKLRAGQRVVLMPGSDRSSILADLFQSFDDRLGPVWVRLYDRAFDAAWANAGGTDVALAARVGVDWTTVASWRRREHRPQQDEHLNAVLRLSEIPQAWTFRTQIRAYLATVRGQHRLIAKILNEAVIETVVELEGTGRQQLEDLGLDLDEFLGSIQVLTVASVSSEIREAPSGLVGHFLTSDHPAVKGAA